MRFAVRSREARANSEVVYEFDQTRVVIGRGRAADILLPDPSVSQAHAVVRQQDVRCVLVDDGSTNGTYVNGQRVVPGRPKPLRNGDRIRVGVFEIGFDSGIAVPESTSADRTSALARRFVRELWAADGSAMPAPRLQVVAGPDEGKGLEMFGAPARIVVGRGNDCDLALSDADVSREHVALVCDADGIRVEDLGSKNGMTVNGRATRHRRLHDRDEIGIGSTVLLFEDAADERLRSLEDEPDAVFAPPSPEDAEESSSGEGGEAEPQSEAAPSPPTAETGPKPPGKRSGVGADMVIYLLAGSIFALSLAGLFFLLRG